jgi:asparagine synthase (glutamine-hydrolysing)
LFTLIADSQGIDEPSLNLMARTLRGGSADPRFAFDEAASRLRRFGAAARSAGFLPEDRFDTQPLISPNGDIFFVCQARLDNRQELLERLPQSRPAGEVADSSLLFAAFLKWGEACNDNLTGDYVYAAYSCSGKKLMAAVDHVGHFRLYYAVSQGRIILSTQLAALRACPTLSLTCNEVALGMLAESQFEHGETPFNEVKALRGGHRLTWTPGQIETRRWWQPDTCVRTHFSNPHDYVERARELFGQAVRSCLRSSTPVSTTLSGGLDSGLVTAMAANCLNESNQQLTAYTSAPDPRNASFQRPGWDADDAPFAAQTAALQPNLRHVVLRTDDRVAFDLSPQIHTLSGNPVRNGANYLWIDSIARAAVAAGSRVLLTGARGNFSVSYAAPGVFAEMFWRLHWRAAFQFASTAQRAGERAAWKTIIEGILPPRLFALLQSQLHPARPPKSDVLSFTSAAFRKQHAKRLHRARAGPRTRTAFVRKVLSGGASWSADPLPLWRIEMRDPTADRRLLEFLLTVPNAAFAQAGRSRGLARELGRGILPDAVRLRRTRGQQAADCASAIQRQIGRYHELSQRMACSPLCRRIFDLEAIRQALDLLDKGETSMVLCGNLDRAIEAAQCLLNTSLNASTEPRASASGNNA